MTAEIALDRRVHACRDDLADARLRGRVEAARFVDGTAARVAVGAEPLRAGPSADARQGSELLYGETVRVFERRGGWSWVQGDVDGYVGWCRSRALAGEAGAATHKLGALRSYLYAVPDIKTPPRDVFHLGSRLTVEEIAGDWARLAGGCWLWAMHLAPLDRVEPDWLATARRYMGAPYAWGGRSSVGLDCSGLVQIALAEAGIAVPRDSDQQEQSVGHVVGGGVEAARPGDLFYWPGHVALVIEDGRILHANGHHMAVAVEPHDAFRARNMAKIGDVRTVRRPG